LTIVDGSATTILTYPLAAGQQCGGLIAFQVFATDGTDYQSISYICSYGAVNKAGTITGACGYNSTGEAKNAASGTLTLSFTDTDDTNAASFKLTPTGSLTETTYYVRYSVISDFSDTLPSVMAGS
jgi:hypothetical protein